ncbi:hypothetical protein AA650_13880 [Anabaena sp. WA102]|jgi:hypothetical protein|uniref:hypothetical protein n=1 Tax=Anabaena sp. WA102 TaxID=1647413 RepID=UPI0006ABF854|nr:hypothetical protein [Anabaena sp. WA102]ALB41409.1 hypothetical protein AA650_13880 [Anabaena sp. WA102]
MSNPLFTEVSLAQQETIAGGLRTINVTVNPTIKISTSLATNIAVLTQVGKTNQGTIGQTATSRS